MLSSFDSPARSTSRPAIVGTVPLRLVAGALLLYLHAWSQAPMAYQALWNGKKWDVIDLVTDAGFPFPRILAFAAAGILVLVIASWLLGFLTRLFSIAFLPLALGSAVVCNHAKVNNVPGAELSLLYFFISLTIVFSGPGWLSLDALFSRKRSARKSRY